MGLADELIAIKMRLQGAASYQRSMVRNTEVTTEFGDAAERAGAQAKSGAVGMDAMAASSKVGTGALTRMKSAGEGLKSTGSKLTSAWTVPIALIGGVGVKMALDFSDSMEQIATQAGASQGEVNRATTAIMNFAKSGKSASGPNDLANGLFRIESAGFRGKRAMDALVKSEELATVGHANLEKTSTAVAAAMATQIKGTKNLTETVGLMNSIVGIGNMRFEDLLSAFSTGLLDRASNFGLSLKEVGAALGTMTTVGQPAAASATRMAMAFNMMAAPTEKAEKAMEGIGLHATDMAMSLRKRGLIPTLEMLKGHLDKTFGTSDKGLAQQAKAISEMFGGGRTSGGLITLMRHVDLLKKKQGELVGVQGKFNTALERTNAQPITKLHQAWAQLQVVLIEIGNALIPVVTKIAEFFVGAAHWFSSLPGPAKTVLLILGGVLAVAGPLLSMIGTMTLGIYALASAFAALDISAAGIPLLIGAVAAVAVGLSGIFGTSATAADKISTVYKNVTTDMERQRAAGRHLVNSEHAVEQAKRRHRVALKAFDKSQHKANEIIGQYGRKSRPAIHADEIMAKKKWSLVRANKALKNAEREHGVAKRQMEAITRTGVLEARHEINLLKGKKEQFDKLFLSEEKSGASLSRLNEISGWASHANERLQGAHKKLNEVILEAAKKVGPKYATFLEHATRGQLEWKSKIHETNEQLAKTKQRIQELGEGGIPELGIPAPLGPGGALNPKQPVHPHHKKTSAHGGGGGTVTLMRVRGGPTPAQASKRPPSGRGGATGGTKQPINVELRVGRRKFGEAMVMAMIDEDENQ